LERRVVVRGRDVAIFFVRGYQRFISPYLGQNCRFHPTCSQYAIQAFEKHGLYKGFILGTLRILRCGPWHPGGFDPVPEDVKPGKLIRGR
jgi:putative membrane protein insertion efficiency factor